MQKFSVVLFALVAIFAIVVPSPVSALSEVKRETNSDRFARGLPPLPPTRRATAKRHQHSQASVPRKGRIQVRDHDHGNPHGYVQNGPTGPHGVNKGRDPKIKDLDVLYNPGEKSIFCLGSQFSEAGFYLGARVTNSILGDHSTDYVTLGNVEIGVATAEAGIWVIDPDSGKLSALWVNIDGSTVTLGFVYQEENNNIFLVGNPGDFINKNQGCKQVDLLFV